MELQLKDLLKNYEHGFIQLISGGTNEITVKLSECRIYLNPVYDKWCLQYGGESFRIPSEKMKIVDIKLNTIKEDIVGALITLGINSLSDQEKIKETEKILLETLKYIDEASSK